jgi:membrane protein DedA with SNARE-associated domain
MTVDQLIGAYGCWTVFVLVGLENAGLPLPGEITLITAAVLAAKAGHPAILWVILAATAGALVGACAGYAIGRLVGFPFLRRHGRRLGLGPRQVKLGQYLFLRYGIAVVFLGRMLAVLRVLTGFLAGVNRMPWRRFLASSAAGALLWATLFGSGGYIVGRRLGELAGPAGIIGMVITAIALVIGIHLLRRHQRELEDAAERALPGDLG